jgi:hypothetical protein
VLTPTSTSTFTEGFFSHAEDRALVSVTASHPTVAQLPKSSNTANTSSNSSSSAWRFNACPSNLTVAPKIDSHACQNASTRNQTPIKKIFHCSPEFSPSTYGKQTVTYKDCAFLYPQRILLTIPKRSMYRRSCKTVSDGNRLHRDICASCHYTHHSVELTLVTTAPE